MLAFIASGIPGPTQDVPDRDPGVLTLAFALVRALRHSGAAALARRDALARAAGGPNPL